MITAQRTDGRRRKNVSEEEPEQDRYSGTCAKLFCSDLRSIFL